MKLLELWRNFCSSTVKTHESVRAVFCLSKHMSFITFAGTHMHAQRNCYRNCLTESGHKTGSGWWKWLNGIIN